MQMQAAICLQGCSKQEATVNKLDPATRAMILRCLVEGNSIRATCRLTDTSKNTVTKLLEDAGRACLAYHDKHVRGVRTGWASSASRRSSSMTWA